VTLVNGDSPSIVVRAVYFVLVGWWATGLWIGVAWALNTSIIGLPFGIKMVNMVPKVLTLKERNEEVDPFSSGNQPSLVVRAVYFLLIGWWLSFVWMTLAYVVSLTVVGLPIGIKMFNYLPKITSLYEY